MRNSYTALLVLCFSYVAVFSISAISSIWWISCLIEIAALALPIYLSKKLLICQATPRDYHIGFSPKSLPCALFFLPFFVGGVLLLSMGTTALAEQIGYNGSYQYDENIWVCLFASALLPAILEELFCRYIFLPRLTIYSRGGAILASALFFSLLHGNFVQIPYAFFAGLFLGAIAVACNSVLPCILFHFINNTASILLYFYEDTILPNVLFYTLLVSLLVGAIGIFLFRHKIWSRIRYVCGHNDPKSEDEPSSEPYTSGRVVAMLFTSPLVILLVVFLFEAILRIWSW